MTEDDSHIVSPQEALQLARQGAQFIDVRTSAEFSSAHIQGSINVALGLGAFALPVDRSTQVVTVCAFGRRSFIALLRLRAQGYAHVKSMRGGLAAWKACGLPMRID